MGWAVIKFTDLNSGVDFICRAEHHLTMKRKFLFDLYQTPRGKLLQTMEGQYLNKAITVSCKQWIVQIGGLGWEHEFIDCDLYQNFTILDRYNEGCRQALHIQGRSYALPLQTASMDLIIVPHLLEFDQHRFFTLREIDRVLKPGGELIVLNFNPFSLTVRYQYLLDIKLADSWLSHFISRRRMLDWLKLMNFEMINHVEFNLDTFTTVPGEFKPGFKPLTSMAYGLKAVKRTYKLIPVGRVSKLKSRFVPAARQGLEQRNHYDKR